MKDIKFADAHPTAHGLIVSLAAMLIVFFAATFIEAIGSIAVMLCQGNVSKDSMNNLSDTTASAVISLIAMALIMLLYWQKHRHELQGFFNADRTGTLILLGWSELIINIFIIAVGIFNHKTYGNPLTALLLGMQPGVSEEITFRIIPISLAMRSSKREQLIMPVLILTSAAFGLSHGINIFAGADPVTTLFQVIYATGTGCLFAAIYMRTGNMWTIMLLHSVTDIVYYFGAEAQSGGGVLTDSTGAAEAAILLIYAALYFVNAYVVFRNKKAEAVRTWSAIWQTDQH